jgi:heme-degrading monooxygenase HmoA
MTYGEELIMATNPAHARIAIYQVQPGTADAVIERARNELLPQVQQSPGFRRYTTLRTGPDSLVSITGWDSKEQAEQAIQSMTGWVREVLGPSLVSVQNHLGELAFLDEVSTDAPGYGRVALFQLKPGTVEGVREKTIAELPALLRQQPGYIRYVALQTGPESVIAYSGYATQEAGEASLAAIGGWIAENVTPSVASIERHAGPVIWSVRKD